MRKRKREVRNCVGCGCECRSAQFQHSVEETRCYSCAQKGGSNLRKGGQIQKRGYIYIHKPEHPRVRSGNYIKRSHLVWEAANGRYLQPGEVIPHIDGSRDNDVIENLQLMTQSEHMSLHMRGKKKPEIEGKNNPAYKHGKYVGDHAKRKRQRWKEGK